MKTVIKEEQSTEWIFPCLAKGKSGLVIAVRGLGDNVHSIEGTVITPNESYDLFYHSTDFLKDYFTPIPTPVTIDFIPD